MDGALDRTGTDGGRRRSNGRRVSQPWPVALSVFADLLGSDTATPYRAAKKFGLRPWLFAQVRGRLTKSAWYCAELDLERAIRFNASILVQQARLALARRATHRGRRVDPEVLASALGVQGAWFGGSTLDVWTAYITNTAEQLVEAVRFGHVEDVRLAKAERYLDDLVGPRPRTLSRRAAAAPPTDVVPPNPAGGARRIKRILDGIGSGDPSVRAATLSSWDVMRLVHPDVPDTMDWVYERERAGSRSIFAAPTGAMEILR